jgi:hypothetical protein
MKSYRIVGGRRSVSVIEAVKHGFLPMASEDWSKLVDDAVTVGTPDVCCAIKFHPHLGLEPRGRCFWKDCVARAPSPASCESGPVDKCNNLHIDTLAACAHNFVTSFVRSEHFALRT